MVVGVKMMLKESKEALTVLIVTHVAYVERVESIALNGMVGKVLVSAFQNFLRIENPLNIKKVMNKTVKASFNTFDMSNMSNI